MTHVTKENGIRLTLIGGPTVLIEYQGLRLLTDPTFGPAAVACARGAHGIAVAESSPPNEALYGDESPGFWTKC